MMLLCVLGQVQDVVVCLGTSRGCGSIFGVIRGYGCVFWGK